MTLAPGDRPRFAIIPTKNRPGYLADCITSLTGQVHTIIVVDNGSTPAVEETGNIVVISHDEYPPNISRLWNLGLDLAADGARLIHASEWDVLVVNDDVVCPPGLIDTLSSRMRATSAACAFPDQHDVGRPILHTEAKPVPARTRITGYCFLLRGETGIRADEDFVWWFGDDDIDARSRLAGGSLLVPGVKVEHRAPDAHTRADPVLSEQTNADHKTWQMKWGSDRPVIM